MLRNAAPDVTFVYEIRCLRLLGEFRVGLDIGLVFVGIRFSYSQHSK